MLHSIRLATRSRTSGWARQCKTRTALVDEFYRQGARLTSLSHLLWSDIVRPGDTVLDATCGNGFDSVVLARLCGRQGNVLCVDIQEQALASTKAHLESVIPLDERPHIEYIHESHCRLDHFVRPNSVGLICFNAGYLPKGDHTLCTTAATTRKALDAAAQALRPGGMLSVLCYIKQTGGTDECETVRSWMAALETEEFVCGHMEVLNRSQGPQLFSAWKRDDVSEERRQRVAQKRARAKKKRETQNVC